ncbi:uncharacterized protein BP5553_01276 [Venustampulla echinocandica]|uniref:Uncharacterized protein n=1 Tax=Venustampulla echinocandica TaxID=2656787 RepID=A0A370U0K1_9HELO|nr:uncharacterized protein BP5553_01276 [Venustampulla echinocandica]RDL41297.1 hypothetical protein BP5553_01276 [Venustampulla echinocandica]
MESDNPGSPLPDSDDSEHIATELPEYRLWPPERELNDKKYLGWGRKQYVDSWFEQRQAMFRENDKDKYHERQRTMQQMEREKIEEMKEIQNPSRTHPPGYRPWTPEPKPWNSKAHVVWGRKHFGEEWYEYRLAFAHPEDYKQDHKFVKILDRIEREKKAEQRAERMALQGEVEVIGAVPTTMPSTVLQPIETGDDISISSNASDNRYPTPLSALTDDSRVPWSPGPYSYDEEKILACGQKHYGEDWYEQRRDMVRSLDEDNIWEAAEWLERQGPKIEANKKAIAEGEASWNPPLELLHSRQFLQQPQHPNTDESADALHAEPQVLQPKGRESRRLAGRLPEFGLLPKRGEPAAPYEPPLRHNSDTGKSSTSGHRSRASSGKKSIVGNGAKSRRVSKSTQNGTNRLRPASGPPM